MKVLSPPTDQLYRYPSDKEGKSWFGVYSFEAGSFQEELNALRQKFDCLLLAYDGLPVAQSDPPSSDPFRPTLAKR